MRRIFPLAPALLRPAIKRPLRYPNLPRLHTLDNATMAATEQPQVPEDAIATEPQLPQLSPSDFRVYNSMAEHMDYFVGHARSPCSQHY